eukprot:comp86199_c0_seq1/m.48462 comp86199_c0_seq1/g.48462  ORF comp86199_c0_seq1/g.48462 comp86199_c0_seq1/m.48462 type:complete len:240 (-) comp86199_c0_seq1:184-903(-)
MSQETEHTSSSNASVTTEPSASRHQESRGGKGDEAEDDNPLLLRVLVAATVCWALSRFCAKLGGYDPASIKSSWTAVNFTLFFPKPADSAYVIAHECFDFVSMDMVAVASFLISPRLLPLSLLYLFSDMIENIVCLGFCVDWIKRNDENVFRYCALATASKCLFLLTVFAAAVTFLAPHVYSKFRESKPHVQASKKELTKAEIKELLLNSAKVPEAVAAKLREEIEAEKQREREDKKSK